MRKNGFTVFASLLIVGCASSTGVQRLGPDTYLVSSQVIFGPSKAISARAAALKEADEFCAKQGKEVLIEEYRSSGHAMSVTGDGEVRFKCLERNDKDLKRPLYRSNPDIVIENRITK